MWDFSIASLIVDEKIMDEIYFIVFFLSSIIPFGISKERRWKSSRKISRAAKVGGWSGKSDCDYDR